MLLRARTDAGSQAAEIPYGGTAIGVVKGLIGSGVEHEPTTLVLSQKASELSWLVVLSR